MRPGWDASAVLQDLLRQVGVTQEDLAATAGMRRTDVNPYFTGKRLLGERVAARLAQAFAQLGADDATERLRPPEQPDGTLLLRRRLEAIEAELAKLQKDRRAATDRLAEVLQSIADRLDALEADQKLRRAGRAR